MQMFILKLRTQQRKTNANFGCIIVSLCPFGHFCSEQKKHNQPISSFLMRCNFFARHMKKKHKKEKTTKANKVNK